MKAFKKKVKNDILYYVISDFERTGLVEHMFTSRIGGVSQSPYNSLNLGINTKDKPTNVITNLEKVAAFFDGGSKSLVIANQVHGTRIKLVDEHTNIGLEKEKVIEEFGSSEGFDGLLTNRPGVTLSTYYADCVPLFFLDPVQGVIGLGHGGWRGTVEKIAGKIIDKMTEMYQSELEDILVGIGPAIGACCYEIDERVYQRFNKNFKKSKNLMKPTGTGKWMLDLKMANQIVLEEKGIRTRNITMSRLCTSCHSDIFYSFRKQKGQTGRMLAMMQLKHG